MASVAINLIPASRRHSRLRRLWIKRWTIVFSFYALAVVALCAVSWPQTQAPQIHQQHIEAQAEQARLESQIQTLSLALEDKTDALRDSMQVFSRPDWSVLLAILADQLKDQLLLRRCRLWPDESPHTPDASPPVNDQTTALINDYRSRRFRLELSGVARSQQAVSHFLLRLEQARLFDSVTLVNTHQTQYLSQDATGFEIICTLSPDGAPK